MVADHSIRNMNNLAVHLIKFCLTAFRPGAKSTGVKRLGAFQSVPFVRGQPVVICWVDDGEFPSCQSDFSERIAVANPPSEKHERRNAFCDQPSNVRASLDDCPPPPNQSLIANCQWPIAPPYLDGPAHLSRKNGLNRAGPNR